MRPATVLFWALLVSTLDSPQVDVAMTKVFRNYNSANRWSVWNVPAADRGNCGLGPKVIVQFLEAINYGAPADHTLLLTSSSIGSTGHFAIIGSAIVGGHPSTSCLGVFNSKPDWERELVIGPNKSGLWSSFSYDGGFAQQIIVGEIDGVVQVLADIPTSQPCITTTKGSPCFSYMRSLRIRNDTRTTGLYDIEIQTRFWDNMGGKAVDAKKICQPKANNTCRL